MIKTDTNNLSLIYEASIQQQRALMKEIQRRRAAGEPPLTPAEQSVFLKPQESIDRETWFFEGTVAIEVRTKEFVREIDAKPTVKFKFDIVNIEPNETLSDVMGNDILHAFPRHFVNYVIGRHGVNEGLKFCNKGREVNDDMIRCSSAHIDLESKYPDDDAELWNNINIHIRKIEATAVFNVNEEDRVTNGIEEFVIKCLGAFYKSGLNNKEMEIVKSLVIKGDDGANSGAGFGFNFFIGEPYNQWFIDYERR